MDLELKAIKVAKIKKSAFNKEKNIIQVKGLSISPTEVKILKHKLIKMYNFYMYMYRLC